MSVDLDERDLFALVTRHSSDLSSVVDAGGRFLYASPSFERGLGYAPAALVGTSSRDLLHPDDLAAGMEPGFAGRGADEPAVFRMRHADGAWRWFEATGSRVERNGQVLTVTVSRDITVRREAEERRVQLEAIHELSDRVGRAETLPAVYDAAFTRLERTTGTSRAAVLLGDAEGRMRFKAGRNLSDAFRKAGDGHDPWRGGGGHPEPVLVPDVEADPALEADLPALRAEGIRALACIPLLHGSGVLGKFMLYRDAPHPWPVEEVRLALTVARHVAFAVQRQRAAQALGESEHELRDFVEHAPLGLHRLADDGTILWANQAELALLGYARDEYVGQPIARFYADPDVIADILARLRRSERLENVPARLRAKDGTVRHALVSSSVKGERGAFPRCFTRDVTPLVRAEAQRAAVQHSLDLERARLREAVQGLRAANARLLELDQLKTQFLNTVAHELRTPLTPMSLQFEMLREALAGQPEQARSLVILQRNLGRLSRLVEDLLDVARLQGGRFQMVCAPVDLDQVVGEAVASFGQAAEAGGVELVLQEGKSGPVVCDAGRVGQVVFNLLSNALKFTPAGGRIEVSTSRRAGEVELRVHDTGAGLAPKQVQELFQPFTQVHDVTHGPGGTGLGLFMSKGIVEQHGGSIRGESDGPDKGATFIVTLPLKGPESASPDLV